jgi:hypothetical protein
MAQYVPTFRREPHGHVPESSVGGCYECDARSFRCPSCNREIVKIDRLVDIFHVGLCPYCGAVDEPCPERTKGKQRRKNDKTGRAERT